MAALVKIKNLIAPLASGNNGIMYNVIRTKVYTKFDYMPGPRPKTEAEMQKAAEKYGLHRSEYKLYPDDGMHPVGDYPNLPEIGDTVKDPYYPYDYPAEKRNYGETLHANHHIMTEDRIDYGEQPLISYGKAQWLFWGIVMAYAAVCYWAQDYPLFQPALKQQYAQPGAVHYTFEPAK